MKRTIAAASVLLALAGCQYNKEGVYVVYLPVAEDLDCQDNVSENITDADPRDDVTTTDSSWIFDEVGTESDGAMFAQIFESKDGNVILQMGTQIYTGTVDGGVITVSWENFTDTVETESNADADYSYKFDDNTTVTNTITLTKNKDTKGYSGTWKSDVNSTFRVEESDEWDVAAGYYYVTAGQINNEIQFWLEGAASNSPDMVDCDSDPCFIEVSSVCSGSYNFQMVETDLDSEAYTGVEDAGQPNGLGF